VEGVADKASHLFGNLIGDQMPSIEREEGSDTTIINLDVQDEEVKKKLDNIKASLEEI